LPGTAVQTDGHLPTPAERPNADVVVFDGNCRICRRQISRLAWWDCQGKLAYMSLHDPEVPDRYPDLTHEMLMRDMYLIDQRGRRYRGAEVLRYLSRRLRRLWWIAPLLHIPGSMPVWQWLYRQVADRRYRWGAIEECREGSCAVHGRAAQSRQP
jgi:predicted DCC family thiol-disulfide oxidoreductase YuxK